MVSAYIAELQSCCKGMPTIGPEEEIIAGDQWVRYQEMELKQDEMQLKS